MIKADEKYKFGRKPRRKPIGPHSCRYRDRYGMSIVEMASITGWSTGSIHNVLNDEGYDDDKEFLLKSVKKHLKAKK